MNRMQVVIFSEIKSRETFCTHTNEEIFQDNVCCETFSIKCDFIAHMFSHKQNSLHVYICCRSFFEISNLAEDLHSNVKSPLVCGQSFFERDILEWGHRGIQYEFCIYDFQVLVLSSHVGKCVTSQYSVNMFYQMQQLYLSCKPQLG